MNETISTDYTDQYEEEPEILDFTQASSRLDARILIGQPIIFSHQIENFLKHQKDFMNLTVNNEKILLEKIEQQVKIK